ncbi:MAG: Hsp33 family molecular chaperone HslO [Bacillota bacterium]
MDYLLRAADPDGLVRAFAAVSTDLVGEAARRHETSPLATAALGRARAAELLVSLGREELAALTERTDPTEMRCHFCNEVYRFRPEEVRVLLDRALTATGDVEEPAAGGAPPGDDGTEG